MRIWVVHLELTSVRLGEPKRKREQARYGFSLRFRLFFSFHESEQRNQRRETRKVRQKGAPALQIVSGFLFDLFCLVN